MKHNSKFKIQNSKLNTGGNLLPYTLDPEPCQMGFTLLELIIVIALFMVTGVLILGVLNSTFKLSNKTRITNDLAQNGNYALSIMSNLLFNSQKLLSYTTSTGVVLNDCTGNPGPGKSITVLGFDGGAATLTCDDANGTISSTSAIFSSISPTPTPYATSSLIDTSQVKLSGASCTITCTQQNPYSPPRVDVSFQLIKSNAVVGEGAPSANFNTSITLRNQNIQQ